MRRVVIIGLLLVSALSYGQRFAFPNSAASGGGETLGSEKVTDGTFPNATNWDAYTSWSIPGTGGADYADVSTSTLRQSDGNMVSGMEASTDYKMTFDITISSGNASLRFMDYSTGEQYVAQTTYANGSHTVYFTTPSSIGSAGIAVLGYATTTDNTFNFNNLSIKEVL